MKEIDPKETSRASAFEMWMSSPMPMVTMTKTFDVSNIVKQSRKMKISFNSLLCWCIGKTANQIDEFFILPEHGKLFQYDKIAINVIVNNKNVGIFGSQGQQRNAILSSKLAMAELIFEIKKEAPTLLLDDVFSELDKNRQNALINSLNPNFQTIITTASISDLDKEILDKALIIKLDKRSE